MTAQPAEPPDLGNVNLPAPSTRQGDPGHDQALERANAIRLLTLRAAGMTYEQIAAEVGYSDGSGARQALVRALARHEAENVSELRTVENMRLDTDERTIRTIISDPDQPAGVRLRAIDARTRLSARRARMNGLDAPIAVQISAGVAVELEDALSALEQLMAGSVPGEVLTVTDEAPDA